jgi:hypothetical protein
MHWPDVDEDISAEGMLGGIPARRPQNRTGSTTPANRPLQPTSRMKRKPKSKTRSRAARG